MRPHDGRNPRPLLLGHRGASRYAPENTLRAFDLALQHGCDGFEFDVRFTSDHCSVLCHDPFLNALEIATSSYGELCRSGSPEQVAELRGLHRRKGSVHSAGTPSPDSKLASLEDVLRAYADSAFLDIEFKVEGAIDRWLPALRRHAPSRGYVVSSFLPEVLTSVHAADPSIPLGLIIGTDEGGALGRWHTLPVSVLILNIRLITAGVVEQVHAAGKQAFVWTVNDRKGMLEMSDMGVDAIISDDTKLLRDTFLNSRDPNA